MLYKAVKETRTSDLSNSLKQLSRHQKMAMPKSHLAQTSFDVHRTFFAQKSIVFLSPITSPPC